MSSDNQESSSDYFSRAVRHTLISEGVFSNHTWDPGGKTKYGITEWLARKYKYDVMALTTDQAISIYRAEFWSRLGLDRIAQVSWRVAVEIFDTAVNCGTDRAVRILQESLSTIFEQPTTIDGKIGPSTLAATLKISRTYETQLVAALNGFQFVYYIALLRQGHPAARPAIKGWMRRLVTPEK